MFSLLYLLAMQHSRLFSENKEGVHETFNVCPWRTDQLACAFYIIYLIYTVVSIGAPSKAFANVSYIIWIPGHVLVTNENLAYQRLRKGSRRQEVLLPFSAWWKKEIHPLSCLKGGQLDCQSSCYLSSLLRIFLYGSSRLWVLCPNVRDKLTCMLGI
jgi:hypothetical protein